MQLHYIILLAAAVAFYGADASVSTNSKPTQAISLAVDEKNVPATRLLRSYDEEERGGVVTWIKSVFQKNKYEQLSKQLSSEKSVSKQLSSDKAQLSKQLSSKIDPDFPAQFEAVARQTVGGAFKTFNLDKMKSVDDFFSNPKLTKLGNVDDLFTNDKFTLWQYYIGYMNRGSKNTERSVAKSISSQFGDDKAALLFAAATKSQNSNVKALGNSFQKDLFKQWTKTEPMKKPEEVAKLSKSIAEEYDVFYKKAIEQAKKKIAEGKKFARARADRDAANLAKF